ncbi:MAG TPA: SDR family oxidoreductase [Desulfobacterales bacterium]
MTFPYKKALVTGGAGFIGSHLTQALLEAGCRVVVLDDLSSGSRGNLTAVDNRIRFLEGDVRDFEAVDAAAQGCEAVFHLAAVVSVPRTVAEPLFSAMVNDVGTLHVFEAARRQRAASLVFASSSAAYGDDPRQPKHEALIPEPLSPYAVQKITGEHYAGVYHRLFGIKTTSLRFFNVYGPRQDPGSPYSGVISIFMDRACRDRAPIIYGDGSQSRDFVYVQDVVRACLDAAASPSTGGMTFNVGTGRATTINELWQTIGKLSGCRRQPEYEPPRSGDILHSLAQMDRIRAAIGFAPRVTLEEGLALTYQWYGAQ